MYVFCVIDAVLDRSDLACQWFLAVIICVKITQYRVALLQPSLQCRIDNTVCMYGRMDTQSY